MDRKKILVVDDDEPWLETISLILGGSYELDTTTDRSNALTLARSHTYPLAILDQRFPGDNTGGVRLLVQLLEIQPDLRGIILTGHAELEDVVTSVKLGAFDYIEKGNPKLAEELLVRVERALSKDPPQDAITTLISKGESAELEFKSSARWDVRQNKLNRDMEDVIVKTIASFLNSATGGVLLIGVDDSGRVVGLENDYKSLKKQNRDGFENFLATLLLGAYGGHVGALLRVDFQAIDGKDVCRITARPAPKAVYVPDGTLYVRSMNTSRPLSARETVDYCHMRWK